MIDIENKIIDEVSNAVLAEYPSASCTNEYIDVPANFPCVTIIEEDNYTYQRSQDDSLQEHHARVMYTINIYSNKLNDGKFEAKNIAKIVDEKMQSMKFTRTMMSPVPNEDRTIYRIALRYYAIISQFNNTEEKKVNVYRR